MWEIREYKPLALVFYIDGNGNRNALPLDDTRREQFKQIIESQKMVELEWITINTFDIKEIRPASKTSELEKYYYNLNYQDRAFISSRVKSRAQNQKVNVLEWLSELWDKAIWICEWWIRNRDWKIEQQQTEQPKREPITDEQKEFIKARFREILSSYQTNRW